MLPNELIAAKEAAARYLVPFCIATDPKYQVNWHHELIALKLEEALEKAVHNEKARIILELPPRHGKSEEATIKFPAWALGKYPDLPIIVSSYSSELSQDFGLKTRDLVSSENYQAIFKVRLRADSKAKGKWITSDGGSYTATGVGGAITGRGFKVGIIDDPIKNREEAESITYRNKVWSWYTSTFYTRQEGQGAIIVILTRWHTDDLVGRLLEKQEADEKAGLTEFDQWEVVRFPAVADTQEQYRNIGDPLWPEKFNSAALENIKNTVGIYDWVALYQQDPIATETQEFKKEWFRNFEEADLQGKQLIYTTTIDPAVGEGKEADNSVVRTVGKELDKPNWYLIEESAGKMDPLQLIDAVFYHYEKYRSSVFLETVAYQKALKYFITEEQKKRQVYFSINELKKNNEQSKEVRIRGLIPLYKAGVIFHRRSDYELEKELLQFPKGKHDDRIDALASQLEAVENTRKVTKVEQPPIVPTSPYEGQVTTQEKHPMMKDVDLSKW
jgi:predicted phage terminase large subunit-like protein